MAGAPAVTVFTSTVYADVARLWHACITRAFPPGAALVEIFDDSPRGLDPHLFPGATIMPRGPARRDFHEAYNDALARAVTPYLAFVDSDVFWVDPGVFRRAREDLARDEVAAVSCVSRSKTESHGTFAVVMKVAAYRKALAHLPDGFFPRIENLDPSLPAERWSWHDTGDLATRAVVAAGWEVRLLNLETTGSFARFDGITLSRRAAEWMGPKALVTMAGESDYFWHGYAGNSVLASLHDRLFPAGPRYAFPFARLPVLWLAGRGGPRAALQRVLYLKRILGGAGRIARFVRGPEPHSR
jgi:hypothetical protein